MSIHELTGNITAPCQDSKEAGKYREHLIGTLGENEVRRRLSGHANHERLVKALMLSEQGLTYSQIGKNLGVSYSRAYQLAAKAHRLAGFENNDLSGLSVRATNCLRQENITSLSELKKAFLSGKVAPGVIPNYGHKTHLEVCHFIGVQAKGMDLKTNPETVSRYIAYLEKRGYTVTRQGCEVEGYENR